MNTSKKEKVRNKKFNPQTGNSSLKNKGFTLVEMMISAGLFTIIIFIGIGAVLTVSSVHKKNQKLRSVIDTVSFAMEDMARNARLGNSYNCNGVGDCVSGWSYEFSFEQVYGSPTVADEYVYKITPVTVQYGTLEKSEDSGVNFYQILPPEVRVDLNKSGFQVLGSSTTDDRQPYVRIRLAGDIDYRGVQTPFALETMVSQRQVDQ
jgi:type II secretory pathway pseudopilin PulG